MQGDDDRQAEGGAVIFFSEVDRGGFLTRFGDDERVGTGPDSTTVCPIFDAAGQVFDSACAFVQSGTLERKPVRPVGGFELEAVDPLLIVAAAQQEAEVREPAGLVGRRARDQFGGERQWIAGTRAATVPVRSEAVRAGTHRRSNGLLHGVKSENVL